MLSKKRIQDNSPASRKLYNLISATEKKSALDYYYWETRMLHQISNQSTKKEFEKNFINLAILSKNNEKKKKALKMVSWGILGSLGKALRPPRPYKGHY